MLIIFLFLLFSFSNSMNISYIDPLNSLTLNQGTQQNPYSALNLAFSSMTDNQNTIIFQNSGFSLNETLEICNITTSFYLKPEGNIGNILIFGTFYLNISGNGSLKFENLTFSSKNQTFSVFQIQTNDNSSLILKNCVFMDINFNNQSWPFIYFNSGNQFLLENSYFINVEYPPNSDFIQIISNISTVNFTKVTVNFGYFYSSNFINAMNGIFLMQKLIFSNNLLIKQSIFLQITGILTFSQSMFSNNNISNSSLIKINPSNTFFGASSFSFIDFMNNSCPDDNDLEINLLMTISLANADFYFKNSTIQNNTCKSSFMFINQTMKTVNIQNLTFLDNFSSKLMYFYANLQLNLTGIIVKTNNNYNKYSQNLLENFAGTCFYFNSIASLSLTNSLFTNSYSSILPTVLSFQENLLILQSITPFPAKILIQNTNFSNNFFNFSTQEFPNKDEGCCISSVSSGFITVSNCLFLNNSFNIPSDPSKGGPGINIKNEEATLLIEKSKFFGNQANFQSNSVYFLGFNVSILDSEFTQNSEFSQINVKLAGGVFLIFTYASVNNCLFQENRGYNGGISISLGSFGFQILNVNFCKFIRNWVSYAGAGINIDETGVNRTCFINNSVFDSNYADNYAAAVFIFGAGVTQGSLIAFSQCFFNQNMAVWEGGAFSIWLYYPFYAITFDSCIFNGSKVIGSGNSIMGACLDYWGDSSWIKTNDISFIRTKNCVFNNSFSFTGSGLYIVSAIYYDFNSSFFNNYAAKEGGTILLSDDSQIFLNFTQIINSQSLYSAGSIGGKEQVKLFLNNILFLNSYSKSGAGIYLDSNSLLFADNLTFNGNSGEVGSGILIRNTNDLVSYINNSFFSQNTGSYSVVQIEYSTLFMQNSTMELSNVACLSSYSSLLYLSAFDFRNSKCADQITGCSLYLRESSNIILSDSSFSNISGKTVGAIYIEFSNIQISNTSFQGCFSEASGDIILGLNSLVYLLSVRASNFLTTPIDLNFAQLSIKNSIFTNNVQQLGSVIHCLNCENLLSEFSSFKNLNSSGIGSAFFIETYDLQVLQMQVNIINNCSFEMLSSTSGGAFYIQNNNVTIYGSNFTQNRANKGGSIYFSCSNIYTTNCQMNLTNNFFFNNSAYIEGGAVKWTGKKPINIPQNTFLRNSAQYGRNIASFPVRLGISIKSNDLTIYDTLLNTSAKIYLPNEQSGGKINHQLFFYFLDENDEKIDTINLDYLKIDLYSGEIPTAFLDKNFINITHDEFYRGNSSLIYGETFQIINSSISAFSIADLTIIGTPTSVIYLQISTMYTSINPEFKAKKYANNPHDLYYPNNDTYYFILPVVLRQCIAGETYNISDNQCTPCVSGKYSFNPKDPTNPMLPSQCLSCIPFAFCFGGADIELFEGFWRKNIFSTTLYSCNLNSMSCLGGLNSDCMADYTGTLCESCSNAADVVRSKNFMDLCQECPHWVLGLVVEFILFVILVGMVIMCYQVFRLKKFDSKQVRFLVRLLISYFQFIYVSGTFNVQLPMAIKVYISVFELYTLLMRNWINSSCLLSQMSMSQLPQFHHLIFGYIFLILVFGTTFLIWSLHLNRRPNPDSNRSQKIELFITFCYIFNGPLVFLALHVFKCVKIEGKLYLESSPDYECYGNDHFILFIIMAFPILLLFVVVYPLVIYSVYLRKGWVRLPFKLRKIWNIGCIKDSKKIFFEFYTLGVKYALIGIIVFFDKNDIKKPITAFFLMLSFTKSFLIVRPFKYKFFTKMSILAFGAVSSIYLAFILYFSNTSSPNTRVFFVTLTLLLNSGFVGSVIYFITTAPHKKKLLKKESILDASYELRFKAFKTFGSSFDKRDRANSQMSKASNEIGDRSIRVVVPQNMEGSEKI